MAIPTLNGTAVYPSDIGREKTKIGKTQVNANGGRTFIQRTNAGGAPFFKNSFNLSFKGITEARRGTLETIANLITTFVYADEHGTARTCQSEADAYSETVAFIAGNGDIYYNVSLMIYEV